MHRTDLIAQRLTRDTLGLVRRGALSDAGIAYSTIRSRVTSGVWAEPLPGVIDVTRQSWTWERRVLAATLAAPIGTLASHTTAAALHRFPGFERRGKIELLVPRTGRNVDLPCTVHSTLHPDPGTVVDHVPCTSAARTPQLLAMLGDQRALARGIRAVLRRGLATAEQILDPRLRTTPGYALLHRTLEAEVAHGVHRVDSWLEEAWVDRMLGWDLPPFVTQHPLRVEGYHYRLDVAWPQLMTSLEGDGDGFHGDHQSQDADGRRGARIGRAGFDTIRVGERHLHGPDADRVRRRLTAMLSR